MFSKSRFVLFLTLTFSRPFILSMSRAGDLDFLQPRADDAVSFASIAASGTFEPPPKSMMSRLGRRQRSREKGQQMYFLNDLKMAFNEADVKESGRLTFDQWCSSALIEILHDGRMTQEEFENYFKRIDANCDGFVTWSEFVSYLMRDFNSKGLKSQNVTAQFIRKLVPVEPTRNQCHRCMVQQIEVCNRLNLYITISSDSIRFWDASDMSFQRAIANPGMFARMLMFDKYLILAVTTMNRKLILFDVDKFEQLSAEMGASPTAAQIKKMSEGESLSTLRAIKSPHLPLFNAPAYMARADVTSKDQSYSFFFVGDDQGVVEVFKLIEPIRRKGSEYTIERATRHMTHTDVITQISTIESLECYASASYDCTVKFWTFYEKPEPVITVIRVFTDSIPIVGFNFSNSQKVLVTCCASRDAFVWSTSPPRRFYKFEQHNNQLQAMTDFVTTTNEKYILTLTVKKEFRLWDAVNYRMVREWAEPALLRPENRYGAIMFDMKRHALIAAACSPTRWAEDVSALSDSLEPVTHRHLIVGCQMSDEFNQLVTVDTIGAIRVWNINDGTLASSHIEPITSDSSDIATVTLDDTGRRLITSDFKNRTLLWNYNSGTVIAQLELRPASPLITIISTLQVGGKSFLVRAGWDKKICMYMELDRGTFDLYRQFSGHKKDISAVTSYESGLVSGSATGEVFSWTLETSMPAASIHLKDRTGVECMACYKSFCFIGDSNGFLHVVGVPKLPLISSMAGHGLVVSHSLSAITVDRDSKLLYTADTYGYVKKWAIEEDENHQVSLKGLMIERCHNEEISHLTLIYDGRFLATTGVDMCVRLWETDDFTYIGLFTEESKWSLGNPYTYAKTKKFEKDPKHFTKTVTLTRNEKDAPAKSSIRDVSKLSRTNTRSIKGLRSIGDMAATVAEEDTFDIEKVRQVIDDYTLAVENEYKNRKQYEALLKQHETRRKPIKRVGELPTGNRPQDLLHNITDIIDRGNGVEKPAPVKATLKIPTVPRRHGRPATKGTRRAMSNLY